LALRYSTRRRARTRSTPSASLTVLADRSALIRVPPLPGLGAPEILIILAVVLLLFGSTRLPALARSLGQASSEFKAGTREKTGGVTDGAGR
jgi:TatA/E family protein of Tat protein translocase